MRTKMDSNWINFILFAKIGPLKKTGHSNQNLLCSEELEEFGRVKREAVAAFAYGKGTARGDLIRQEANSSSKEMMDRTL